MLGDKDAITDTRGHRHPTFADIVVVVIDHNVEAERLGEEVVGDAKGGGRNGDDVGCLCSFANCFQL